MSIRSIIFKAWYWYVNKQDKNAEVLFMNYGYHDDNEFIELADQDEINRYSIQLYHRLAKMTEIKDKNILEIGCGRGGGLDYIARTFKPATALGIDLDKRAAIFGNSHYKISGLKFEQGNAQCLNLIDSSMDVIFNVESSHRYLQFDKFMDEVYRVLKPGGYFLFTDFRTKEDMSLLNNSISKYDYEIFDEQIINNQVINALNLDTPRREQLVKKLSPKILHKTAMNFAGTNGSETWNKILTGYYVYFIYCFRKEL